LQLWSLGRLNLIGEFDAVGLPGGGGPGQVNWFTLFLLLFRLRLKYFYVTYHGIFQEVGHKIPVQVKYKMKVDCVDPLFLILKEPEHRYLFCKRFVVPARFTFFMMFTRLVLNFQ
jgi:hypothetical protein